MVKEWTGDLKTNSIARDTATNEFVLITNGICIFSHRNEDLPLHKAAHATNGGHCCYTPYEGLVFQTEGDGEQVKVVTWSMKVITGRPLAPVSVGESESILRQYKERLEQLAKAPKVPRRNRVRKPARNDS